LQPSYSFVSGFIKLQPGKSPVVPTLSTPVFIISSSVDACDKDEINNAIEINRA
jgi:hypothetical protein